MTVSFLGHGRVLFLCKRFYHRAFAANSIVVAPALAEPGSRGPGVFMVVAFRVTAASIPAPAVPRGRLPGVFIALALMVAVAFVPALALPGMVVLRPVVAMMVLMGKDGGGSKQQAREGQDGKSDFLPMSRHERGFLCSLSM
jgi:hypothetical protein